MADFKDEIEHDLKLKREAKKLEDEKLEKWREKERAERKFALEKFKKEQAQYNKYKNDQENGLKTNGNGVIHVDDDQDDDDDNDNNIDNIDNDIIMETKKDKNKNNDGFDPFLTISDNDSDNESDESLEKESNFGIQNIRVIPHNHHHGDDDDNFHLDDIHDIENHHHFVENIDFDHDPFE